MSSPESNGAIPRLSTATLSQLPIEVHKPEYDRSEVKKGIVHIGAGAFHRGHQAVLADRLLNKGHKDWGIVDVCMHRPDVRNNLAPQDNLFTVHERSGVAEETRVIGSVLEVLVASEDPKSVIEAIAAPDTKLVTLTVTQNGYHFHPKHGINFDDPDVKYSLEHADQPRVAVAFIVEGLELRRQRGLPPISIMSCDNLPNNSDKLRQTTLAYAGMKSPELKTYIADTTRFFNTMVDRIVPAWKSEHTDKIKENFGVDDQQTVFTEPWIQLVVEVKRPDPNLPPFNEVGANYVADASGHELAKIRMLNGVHMALGAVGQLQGHKLADKAVADPKIRTFVEGYLKEVSATLEPVEGMDYEDYAKGLMARLDNPHMEDALQRLARNGVSKLDSRFLSPLKDAYAHDTPRDHMVTAVAAYVLYLKKADRECEDLQTNDADKLRVVHQRAAEGTFNIADKEAYQNGLVDIAKSLNGDPTPILSVDIWGSLRDNDDFIAEFRQAWADLTGDDAGHHYGKPQPGYNLS